MSFFTGVSAVIILGVLVYAIMAANPKPVSAQRGGPSQRDAP